MEHIGGFLPFITTHSYTKFILACDYAIRERIICLVYGDNGAGKSWSVVEYIRSTVRMTENGRFPYLYINLSQSEKTDRAIYNMIVQSIRGDDKRYGSASDAKAAAFDLWHRYGFRALFVDDVVEIYRTGIEAIRTFHDRGPNYPRIPIILTTIPSIEENLKTQSRYKAFFSRIGQFCSFNKLERNDIGYLLQSLPPQKSLRFDESQEDGDKIIDALYKAAGGGEVARASFRDFDYLLKKCDMLLTIALRNYQDTIEKNPQAIKPRFDIELIRRAIKEIQGDL